MDECANEASEEEHLLSTLFPEIWVIICLCIDLLSIYLLIYLSSLSSPIPSIPPGRKYKKT